MYSRFMVLMGAGRQTRLRRVLAAVLLHRRLPAYIYVYPIHDIRCYTCAESAHGSDSGLFSFPDIGALSADDAAKALRDPARNAGVSFENDALQEIFQLTKGYPYFLQEWGYQAWNLAPSSPITLDIVHTATPSVIRRLDANFFRVRALSAVV